MNQFSPNDQLLILTRTLADAVEREDWDRAMPLLGQLNGLVMNRGYRPGDASTLTAVIQGLNVAIQSATRRKEEIRALVQKLGDSPL